MRKESLSLFVLAVLAFSCAKEKKFEAIYKNEVYDKSLFSQDPNDPYIYVPTVENTPMKVTASIPHYLGSEKLVTFRLTEKRLEVLELPTEEKFSGNLNNFSPVMALEIDHVDYRCKKDQYNECSNTEEEISDISWDRKRFIKADFTKLKVLETNSLPEQLTNLFGECFKEKHAVIKNLEIDKDVVNLTVEKTMSAGIECADLQTFDDLRNVTFKINHHYSFVKRSKLVSPGYSPVLYPGKDENTFGFFTTNIKRMDADNTISELSDKTLMNRWNPERGEIVYYLNDEFYLPRFKRILDATYESVETINNSFKRAGVDLKITLKDGRGKSAGDLRNSFIVLISDPQDSGIIGYGPAVADPKTGEIIKAQTIMFYGSMLKSIRRTYDELVEIEQRKIKMASSEAAALAKSVKEQNLVFSSETRDAEAQTIASLKLQDRVSKIASHQFHAHGRQESSFSTRSVKKLGRKALLNLEKPAYRNMKDLTGRYNRALQELNLAHNKDIILQKEMELEELKEELHSVNCYYNESSIDWASAIDNGLELLPELKKNLRPWMELSEEEKQAFINAVIPSVWVSTLVHEIGHNLGLRHNFNGSEDKDNFYSKEEATALKMKEVPVFSSIMDYAPSTLNELSVMGKYDVAALRFGYARKVELKDGSLASLPASLEELEKADHPLLKEMKDFGFCTDGHVSVNAGCNRHDEGTNMVEIVDHYITQYEKNYERRNKRNKRANFSSSNDFDYYRTIQYTFNGLRLFFETYDRIQGRFGAQLAADPTLWDTIPWLKETKEATKKVYDFYLKVLNTPDLSCLVVNPTNGRMYPVTPLASIDPEASSCFDLQLNESAKVLGEVGKAFNHIRGNDIRSDLRPDPSEISVRGYWLDKHIAMDYLTRRRMSLLFDTLRGFEFGNPTMDDYRSSFMDYPEFRAGIEKAIVNFVSGKIESYPDVRLADGTITTLDKVLNRPEEEKGKPIAIDLGDTHMITRGYDFRIISKFITPQRDFRDLIMPMVKGRFSEAESQKSTMGLFRDLSVSRVHPSIVYSQNPVASTELLDKSGQTIAKFVAFKENRLAIDLMNERNLRLKLEKFKEDKLVEIAVARLEGSQRSCRDNVPVPEVTPTPEGETPAPKPANIPEEECFIWDMDLNQLIGFIRGESISDKDLLDILDILASN